MELPWGAMKEDFERCKKIIFELTGNRGASEEALNLLNIVYSLGGDYSENTLRAFAKKYLDIQANSISVQSPTAKPDG